MTENELKILAPILERAVDSLDDLRIALTKPLETMATKLPSSDLPEYMTTKQAAEYLGVSYQYLEIGRHRHRHGPPYIAMGGKGTAVRYKKSDLDEWMTNHRRTHTGEPHKQTEE
jgi:excisionase family DNA binding protein